MSSSGRVLIIAIGCGLALLVQACSKKVEEVPAQKTTSAPKEITFRNTAIFDGRTGDGERFASFAYKSSDCVLLSHQTTFFKTAARAHKELEKEIKNAARIIERAPLINDAGQQIGERVLVESNTGEENKFATQAIWTENSEFHSAASRSVEHLQQFEQALRSRSEKISNGLESVRQATFEEFESHDARSEDGIAYSEKKFRSSDCEVIRVRIRHLPTPERAQQDFESLLAQSTGVMERGPKLDTHGRRVGERAVAMFKASLPAEYIEETMIAWTDNSELYLVTGVYAYVIVFEQRNYP